MPSVRRHVYQLKFHQFEEKLGDDGECERNEHQQVVFRLVGDCRQVLCHGCVAIDPVGKISIGLRRLDHLAIAAHVAADSHFMFRFRHDGLKTWSMTVLLGEQACFTLRMCDSTS